MPTAAGSSSAQGLGGPWTGETGAASTFVPGSADGKTTRVSVTSRGRQARLPATPRRVHGRGNQRERPVRGLPFGSRPIWWPVTLTGPRTSSSATQDRPDHPRQPRQRRPAEERWERGSRRSAPDGRYVAFSSAATNLVPGDTNGAEDIFVRDRDQGRRNGSASVPTAARQTAEQQRPRSAPTAATSRSSPTRPTSSRATRTASRHLRPRPE